MDLFPTFDEALYPSISKNWLSQTVDSDVASLATNPGSFPQTGLEVVECSWIVRLMESVARINAARFSGTGLVRRGAQFVYQLKKNGPRKQNTNLLSGG